MCASFFFAPVYFFTTIPFCLNSVVDSRTKCGLCEVMKIDVSLIFKFWRNSRVVKFAPESRPIFFFSMQRESRFVHISGKPVVSVPRPEPSCRCSGSRARCSAACPTLSAAPSSPPPPHTTAGHKPRTPATRLRRPSFPNGAVTPPLLPPPRPLRSLLLHRRLGVRRGRAEAVPASRL